MNNKLLVIKKYPDVILRKKSALVEEVGVAEAGLFEDMLFAMRRFKGVGLAAPQVGILRRLIVADVGKGIIRLANPEILKVKGKDKMLEGCLSVPDINVEIERPYEVVVKGVNEKGEETEFKAKGLLAKVIQHEIDHLNGKLIVDYMNFLKRLKLKIKRA